MYGELGPLRLALAEAARTDESNAANAVSRFVEIRPGVVDTLRARRHHFITGRRGTGKSTLLHVVRKRLRDDGVPVAVIDMENYKGRPFPDVLIEILIALFDEVKPSVRAKTLFSDLNLRRQFSRTRRELRALLADPQSLVKNVTRAQRRSRGRRLKVGGSAQAKTHGAGAGFSLGHDATSGSSAAATATAQFEELKIERLQRMASRLSKELSAIVTGATGEQAVVFVDDYYFVRLDDQPDVLSYLQQVVRNTGVWLKVGGVGARMRPFRDGDPPVGMQPDQDIDRVTIDVTLDDFGTAQRFLEQMLDGVLEPLSLTTARLITDTARSRMVLACGGAVARDYVTLTTAALDAAIERLNRGQHPRQKRG